MFKKFILLSAIFITAIGFSQNTGSIYGNILDNEMQNEPLLFANVQLKNADKKTETNFHGNFEFKNLETGNYILVVSYAGYENIEVPIVVESNEITYFNLGMSAKKISLDAISALQAGNSNTLASLLKK
tara:strand:- start:372 stop:758 length:387 start_codon:yes stop_codon:yes gene_type:complete